MYKFIFLVLICHSVLAQIPDAWFAGDSAFFPKINIPSMQTKKDPQLKKQIKKIEELLFQKKIASAKRHCQTFLHNNPTSPFRIPITAILKKITNKNLQLYNTFGISLRPGFTPKIMMTGLHIKAVELRLWKVDFVAMVRSGIDPHLPVVDKKRATLVTKWKKSFSQKWFSTSLNVSVSKEGCYILEADDGEIATTTLFFISHLTLMVKRSGSFMLAWATDLRGDFSGVCKVYVISHNGVIYQGKTNKRGVWGAHLSQDTARVTLLLVRNNSLAIVDSKWFSYEEAKKRCYLAMDRPFYRPGDKAYLMGIVATKTKKGYQIARGEKLRVYVHDEKWHKILDTNIIVDQWGTFEIECFLPKNYIGRYTARISGNFYSSIDFFTLSSKPPYVFKTKPFSKQKKLPKGILYKKDNKLWVDFTPPYKIPVFISWESEKLIAYSVFATKEPWHWQKKISSVFSPQTQVVANYIENGKYRKVFSKISILPSQKQLHIDVKKSREKWQITITDTQQQPVVATCFVSVGETPKYNSMSLLPFFYGHPLENITTFYPHQFELLQDREHAFFPEESKETKVPQKKKPITIALKKFPKQWRFRLTTNSQGQTTFAIANSPSVKKCIINIIAIDHSFKMGEFRSK